MQAAPKPTLHFRHLAGEPYKNKIENIKPSSVSTESCMARGNATFFAFAPQVGGGGSVAVLPNTLSGKMPAIFPMVRGHQGAIHDFDFSPFNDNILATASEDMTLKVWTIPEQYSTDALNAPALDDASITLNAHHKRTSLLAWHPAAENVIASCSLDKTVKVWDITRPEALQTFDNNTEPWLSLDWDLTGNLLGGATKDRRLKIIDGRSKAIVHDGPAHEGPKSTKMLFLGNTDYAFTVGFSKGSEREWKLWDRRKLDVAHATKIIDNQASVLYPFFDHDLNLLFLAGKGDGNIRHFELVDGMLYQNLNDFMAQYPGKCYGFYPKRAMDVMKTEVDRAIKVCDASIEFIAFRAPRRGEGFYEELFPDCLSEEPSMKAEEWFKGGSIPPKRRSMNPKDPSAPKRQFQSLESQASPVHGQGGHANNEKILALEHEIATLKEKIAHLEKENASLTLVNQTQKDELEALRAKTQ